MEQNRVLSEEAIVLQVLKELDQTERNILGLYFYEKLSVGTISQLLEMPVESVESQISSIMVVIKKEIAGEQYPNVEKKEKKTWEIRAEALNNFPVNDS